MVKIIKPKKKENKCAGIRNIFGVCIKAANKTSVFNKGVIDAQDTSLGQFKTDNATTLMGFPSGKGGRKRRKKKTRKKRGGVKWRPVIIRGTHICCKNTK